MQPDSTPHSGPHPVDLEIHVTTPWGRGQRRLEFTLSSPSGTVDFFRERIAGKPLHEPETFQRRYYTQLEQLSLGFDADGEALLREEVANDLIGLGQDLYEYLFPRDLQRIYRKIRDQVRTLLIVSDEPWIPWEMVYPTHDEEDDFLCVRHVFGRWLAGERSLSPDRKLQRLLFVQGGGGSKLQSADSERRLLQDLAERSAGLGFAAAPANTPRDLVSALETESFDLLHFAGHGQHDPKRPAEARILLFDGSFRARHLTAPVQRKLASHRPLVVFNGCQVGQINQSLTDLDGWTQRWIQRCGASAFLAPAWSVADQRAFEFVDTFYQTLAAGHPLGEAVRAARLFLRAKNPGEPSWLAYRFYGSLEARVSFGDAAPSPKPTVAHFNQHSGERPEDLGTQRSAEVPPPPRSPLAPNAAKVFKASPERPAPSNSFLLWLRHRPALALAALAFFSLSWVLAVNWPPLGTLDETSNTTTKGERTPAPPSDSERDLVESQEDPSAGELTNAAETGEPQPSTMVESQETTVSPPPPPPPTSPFPYQPMVPGKVAVLALDQETQRVSQQLARAVRSVLLEGAGTGNVLTPSLATSEIQKLSSGSYSASSSSGGTAWGAEFLLIVTGSFEEMSQSSSHIKSVALTLSSELLEARTQVLSAHSSQSHTGTDISLDGALKQAAERCLRPISDRLNQGRNS